MNLSKRLLASLPLIVFGGIWMYGGIIFPGGYYVMAMTILVGCAYLIVGLLAFTESRWRRRLVLIAFGSLFASIPLGSILLFEIARFGGHIDKERLIQVALGVPLPKGIHNLEGAGGTWQGFDGYFRFRLDSKEMQRYLTANSCTRATLEDCSHEFQIPPRYEKFFSPKWNPDMNESKECYFRHFPNQNHTTTILINRDSDWVYLVSRGATSPGSPPINQVEQAAASNGDKHP